MSHCNIFGFFPLIQYNLIAWYPSPPQWVILKFNLCTKHNFPTFWSLSLSNNWKTSLNLLRHTVTISILGGASKPKVTQTTLGGLGLLHLDLLLPSKEFPTPQKSFEVPKNWFEKYLRFTLSKLNQNIRFCQIGQIPE